VDFRRRREDLLDAAERAIAAKGPGAAMAEVAAEAGYARSAVYAAFPTRTALLGALIERHAAVIMLDMFASGSAEREPRAQFEAMLDALFGWVESRPGLYWALARLPDRPGLLDKLTEAVEAMMSTTLATADADPEAAATWARAMIGSLVGVIEWWLRGEPPLPRGTVVGYLADLNWGGGAALPPGWLGITGTAP